MAVFGLCPGLCVLVLTIFGEASATGAFTPEQASFWSFTGDDREGGGLVLKASIKAGTSLSADRD